MQGNAASTSTKQSHRKPTRAYLLSVFWDSALGFWQRGAKSKAWILTIAIVIVILVNLAVQYRINVWHRDMFNALENGTQPLETFYDGYIVNCIMDAAYRSAESKQWEPVLIDDWRGSDDVTGGAQFKDYDADHLLIKEEVMPDGSTIVILKEKSTGKIIQHVLS